MKGGDKKDIMDFTFEELEEGGAELLAEVTVDWDITYGGKKPQVHQGYGQRSLRRNLLDEGSDRGGHW
jgi:hypothetical protein